MDHKYLLSAALIASALICLLNLPILAHHSDSTPLQFQNSARYTQQRPAFRTDWQNWQGSDADDDSSNEPEYASAASSTISHDYLDEIGTEGIFRWAKDKMPIKVFFEGGSGIDGYRCQFRPMLVQSFHTWMQALQGKLSWHEVYSKEDADIICQWTADTKERAGGVEAGRTKTFTHFNTATNTGTIHHATMILVTQLPERQLTDVEVQKAYLHEVGHALGLAGHSSSRSDIMAAAVNRQQGLDLSTRDVSTINRLYAGYQPVTASTFATTERN